jgi:hypothetical protein
MTPQLASKRWIAASILISITFSVGYGLLLRYMTNNEPGSNLIVALSLAFLTLAPLAMGALAVWFTPLEVRSSWGAALGIAALACLVWVTVVLLLAWEVAICIAMALPIVLPMTMLGAALVCFLSRRQTSDGPLNISLLGLLLLLPLLLGPIEQRYDAGSIFQEVTTSITIAADAETVWSNMIRVPEIQPHEREFRLYHLAGFPWPVEAEMNGDGIDSVRRARYDNGLTFTEPVTEWQPYRSFGFDIHIVEPEQLPAPLNGIGGPYFDVLKGRFVIEPLAGNLVRLHLTSEHRLTTRFKRYGALWTRFLLNDFQEHVLHVIKARSEEAGISGM